MYLFMHTITYISAAKKLLSQEELATLLQRSREYNRKHDITGLLLYKSGSIMQTIEGPEDAVQQLYRNICADPLHHHITTLVDTSIAERAYAGWHMGFKDLDAQSGVSMAGYSDFPQSFSLEAGRLYDHPSHIDPLLFSFPRSIQ